MEIKSSEIVGSVTCVECGEWLRITRGEVDAHGRFLVEQEPDPARAFRWALVLANWTLWRDGDRTMPRPTCPACVDRLSAEEAERLGCPEWCDSEACSGYEVQEGVINHWRGWQVGGDVVVSIGQTVNSAGEVTMTQIEAHEIERLTPHLARKYAAVLVEVAAFAESHGLRCEC